MVTLTIITLAIITFVIILYFLKRCKSVFFIVNAGNLQMKITNFSFLIVLKQIQLHIF